MGYAESVSPGLGLTVRSVISVVEIGAAFTTAYTYGYFFSPEARAL